MLGCQLTIPLLFYWDAFSKSHAFFSFLWRAFRSFFSCIYYLVKGVNELCHVQAWFTTILTVSSSKLFRASWNLKAYAQLVRAIKINHFFINNTSFSLSLLLLLNLFIKKINLIFCLKLYTKRHNIFITYYY